jgi:hypothetical protein
LDGVDMMPALKGEADQLHDHLFWSSGGEEGKWAIRSGKWKLVGVKDQIELFDLGADIGETNDLAESHPEVVSELRETFEAWIAEMADPVGGEAKVWAPGSAAPKKLSREEKDAAKLKKKEMSKEAKDVERAKVREEERKAKAARVPIC